MSVVARKLASLAQDPLGAVSFYGERAKDAASAKVAKLVRPSYTRWCKSQLERRGLLELLENRPTSAYAPYYEDLWLLYRLIRERQPRCVLEFGAGCSTVVMAQALHDNGAGRLYSVDAVEYWAQVTWDLMPKHLQAITTSSATDMVAADFNGQRAMRHANVPDVSPDFIFLDGPDFQDFGRLSAISAACDPVDLESRFAPGFCMVVDGRVENVAFLRKHLKRRYELSHHWPQEGWETTLFTLL